MKNKEVTLVLPQSYVIMKEEEMLYVGGGFNIGMFRNYLNKEYCMNLAMYYCSANKFKNVSIKQIAAEIHGHAVAYYNPLIAIPAYICPDGKGSNLYSHLANGVDIEDKVDKYQTVWNFLW